jgi:hypothetical protein
VLRAPMPESHPVALGFEVTETRGRASAADRVTITSVERDDSVIRVNYDVVPARDLSSDRARGEAKDDLGNHYCALGGHVGITGSGDSNGPHHTRLRQAYCAAPSPGGKHASDPDHLGRVRHDPNAVGRLPAIDLGDTGARSPRLASGLIREVAAAPGSGRVSEPKVPQRTDPPGGLTDRVRRPKGPSAASRRCPAPFTLSWLCWTERRAVDAYRPRRSRPPLPEPATACGVAMSMPLARWTSDSKRRALAGTQRGRLLQANDAFAATAAIACHHKGRPGRHRRAGNFRIAIERPRGHPGPDGSYCCDGSPIGASADDCSGPKLNADLSPVCSSGSYQPAARLRADRSCLSDAAARSLRSPAVKSAASRLASLGPDGPLLTAGPLRLFDNEGPLVRTARSWGWMSAAPVAPAPSGRGASLGCRAGGSGDWRPASAAHLMWPHAFAKFDSAQFAEPTGRRLRRRCPSAAATNTGSRCASPMQTD